MRVATIDIGTNSTRLLIAEDNPKGIKIIKTKLITTRIGEEMGPELVLQEKPMKRTVEALLMYAELCIELKVERVVLVATSAVRDAANQSGFTEMVKNKLDWDIEVLSGQEEALLSYRGVIKGLKTEVYKPVVVDIGGGSTEFIWNSETLQCLSVNAGAVRITEGQYSEKEIYTILKPAIERIVNYLPTNIVGVGGTVTTLAAIDQKLTTYDPDKVHGYQLTRDKVNEISKQLSLVSLNERKLIPGLQPERADIILAGVTILKLILDALNINNITVSETDILYGLLYEKAGY